MRVLGVVLAAVLLAGCTARVGGTPGGDTSGRGTPGGDTSGSGVPSGGAGAPLELAVPIELCPVADEPGGRVLTTEEGERLTVTDPVLTIRTLDGAEATLDANSGGWVVNLDLVDADAAAFAGVTADLVGERLAMVADGEVLIAPEIQAAITGGEVQIAGDYTGDEAEALVDRITGR